MVYWKAGSGVSPTHSLMVELRRHSNIYFCYYRADLTNKPQRVEVQAYSKETYQIDKEILTFLPFIFIAKEHLLFFHPNTLDYPTSTAKALLT